MRRFLAAMAVTLGKRAGRVAVVVAIVTVLLGLGTSRLDFATGQDSYLNPDEEVAVDNEAYQSLFGGQAMVVLFTMDDGKDVVDLFTEANLAELEDVGAELRGGDGIEAVVTPRTALEFTEALVTSTSGDPTASPAGRILLGARERDPDPDSQALRLEDAATTLGRLNEVPADERTVANPDWVRFLLFDNRGDIRKSLRPFFPDETHAQLVVRLTGNASIEEEGIASDHVVETIDGSSFENADVLATGAPVLLKNINDYLRGGFMSLGAIAVGIMVVILAVAFAVRWRLLSLGAVLIGLVWAFGLAGYLGIPLSVVTISGLPVLLGVGIDFAIQMHSRVEEEVVLDRAEHPIQETTVNLVPALLVATFAAVLAFLALELSHVPMIREFGILLAIGIVVVVVADVVVPTAALGWREYRWRTPPGDYTHGPLGRLVVWLGSLPRAAVPVLIVLAVAVFAVGAAVEGSLELQTDPEEWVDQDSQVVEDLDRLQAETGSTGELGMFVQSDDVFDDDVIEFVHGFANEQLDEHGEILQTASSIVTTVSFLIEIPGTTDVPPTGEEVRLAYEAAPEDIRRSTVSEDGEAFNLIFRTGQAPLEERAVVVNEIRDTVDPPEGVRATPSGLAVVGVGLLENLEANRMLLTYVALGLVFVFLMLVMRSIVRAVLCLVPVLIAVGAASLVAKAAGFELSPLTAVGGPLVIALCTEFTSLIMLRFLEERERGEGPRQAVDTAAARTGRAFFTSALAAVTGVIVLAFSSLPLLRDFGIIVAINVAVALLAALVVLPPILAWADDRGWVYRRGFWRPPHEPDREAQLTSR